MKSDKTDHRSRYTQTVIKDGLVKLLNDKPLNKITVAELCEVSQINRGTFYNHFYDVFDVYESIEHVFLSEVQERIDFKNSELDESFFKEIMTLICRNTELISIIFKNKINSELLNRIIAFAEERFLIEWYKLYPNIPQYYLKQIFTYTMNGSLSMISEWLLSGMKQSPDEMSVLIADLNRLIVSSLPNFYK